MRLEELPEMTLVQLKYNPLYRRKFLKVNDIAEITVMDDTKEQNEKSKSYVKEMFYVIGRHRQGNLYVIKKIDLKREPRVRRKYKEREKIDYKKIETIFSKNILKYHSLLSNVPKVSSS